MFISASPDHQPPSTLFQTLFPKYPFEMESPSAVSELNWNTNLSTFSIAAVIPQEHQFAGLMSAEEAEIMAQLLASYQYTNEQSVAEEFDPFLRSNSSWFNQEAMTMVVDGDYNSNSNLYYYPQGNHMIPDLETFAMNGAEKSRVTFMNSSLSKDFYVGDNPNAYSEFHGDNPWEEAVRQNDSGEIHPRNLSETALPEQRMQPKRKMQLQENSQLEEQEDQANTDLEKAHLEYHSGNPQKKARLSGDGQGFSKNTPLKKNQKLIRTDEAEENVAMNLQSSSSYCSEDDSISSQEQIGKTSTGKGSPPVLNLNGKTRAERGSATDPQSLYARKRRERINERLRILQTLVPNGTKVDISTMLEEAVQYVKFLQLQIKLLSSDDLWMYAPIAYNGMDIGLDLKISPQS